jgi:hypothetical protein
MFWGAFPGAVACGCLWCEERRDYFRTPNARSRPRHSAERCYMSRPQAPQRPCEIRGAPPAQCGVAAPPVMSASRKGRPRATRARRRVLTSQLFTLGRGNPLSCSPLEEYWRRSLRALFLEELQSLDEVRDAWALPAWLQLALGHRCDERVGGHLHMHVPSVACLHARDERVGGHLHMQVPSVACLHVHTHVCGIPHQRHHSIRSCRTSPPARSA